MANFSPSPPSTPTSPSYELRRIPQSSITTYYTRRVCTSFRVGPSVVCLFGTFLIINIVSILLEVDVGLYRQWACVAVLCVTHIATLVSMAVTVLTQPGVIPQHIPGYQLDEETFSIPLKQRPPQQYLMVKGGLSVSLKYCLECRIFRPVRAIHCGACNHCVQRFDHHCPWIGVCIGKRNYKSFIAFLVTAIIHALTALVVCLAVFLVTFNGDFTAALHHNLILMLVMVFALWFWVALVVLCIYHMKLVRRGATTNQDLKRVYEWAPNSKVFPNGNTLQQPQVPSKLQNIYLYRYQREDSVLNQGRSYEIYGLDSQRTSAAKPLILNSIL